MRPAPREKRGAERRAGVETAQDEEEEVVGEGAYPVLTAGRQMPAPEQEPTRPAPATAPRHESATSAGATNRVASRCAWLLIRAFGIDIESWSG
uniref:Uncharacterized protein n=1 Tax=Arundo donax TaxID=35708 RepID=A0A0A9FHH3_ARUDO